MTEDIRAAMAVRDLMSAMLTLSELPTEVVKPEWMDLELVEGRLSQLLERIYDPHLVRNLRQRAYGHQAPVLHAVAMHKIPEAAGT